MVLHQAAWTGQVEAVKEAIEKDFDVLLPDKDNNIVLHWAAHKGNEDIVKMVIAKTPKDKVNAKNKDGNTPLHFASIASRNKACKLLLEAGADPNAKNEDGQTPLHGAAGCGSKAVIKTLCEYMLSTSKVPKGAAKWKRPFGCADPNVKDAEGFTPLHTLQNRGFLGAAPAWNTLIECGADRSITGGEWGIEPLHPYTYTFFKIMKKIPLLMLPLLVFWWFVLKPTLEKDI